MNNSFFAYACVTKFPLGSMRFRYNEQNSNRDNFFNMFIQNLGEDQHNYGIVPLELIHSKTVFAISSKDELAGRQGDGILTNNPFLIPALTVADCMPIFLWDSQTGFFGVLHSGWKGTGIVTEAVQKAIQHYGALAKNIHVVVGPHIGSCCYEVTAERAEYFMQNIAPNCIEQRNNTFFLSLKKANEFLFKKAGILPTHIHFFGSCTSCTRDFQNIPSYGSFRRECSTLTLSLEEKLKQFTPMAAFMVVSRQRILFNTQNIEVFNLP